MDVYFSKETAPRGALPPQHPLKHTHRRLSSLKQTHLCFPSSGWFCVSYPPAFLYSESKAECYVHFLGKATQIPDSKASFLSLSIPSFKVRGVADPEIEMTAQLLCFIGDIDVKEDSIKNGLWIVLISGAIASDKSHNASGTGLAPLSAPWMFDDCAGMFREGVRKYDLGKSPAGVRETDRSSSDGSPALIQPSREGAYSLPGPPLSEHDPWTQQCQEPPRAVWVLCILNWVLGEVLTPVQGSVPHPPASCKAQLAWSAADSLQGDTLLPHSSQNFI
ncbi:hypothetical protein DV515_00007727 [Chloebia gouldiae]|uniref:Uncharacterized protein n=1 Tax=Chloebia gouldiae TaxID=44316 RepID=A0A3L8SHR0_CHLGU|nr:hypothetical protein DV515_00007727 [Chloebia gouldiae]